MLVISNLKRWLMFRKHRTIHTHTRQFSIQIHQFANVNLAIQTQFITRVIFFVLFLFVSGSISIFVILQLLITRLFFVRYFFRIFLFPAFFIRIACSYFIQNNIIHHNKLIFIDFCNHRVKFLMEFFSWNRVKTSFDLAHDLQKSSVRNAGTPWLKMMSCNTPRIRVREWKKSKK